MSTFRARYIFPISQPPIENGAITIADGRIVALGTHASGDAGEDLGNVALLPGLINAHTHLEFSDLSAPLGVQGNRLVDWIQTVIAHRRSVGNGPGAIAQGLAESARHGVTTLADIAQPSSLGAWAEAARNGNNLNTVFLELLAPVMGRVGPPLELARQFIAQPSSHNCQTGLSPHAPYSVHPELLRQAVELAVQYRRPVAMHLAESPEEMQLLECGTGPMREFLESIGAWEPAAQRVGRRPLDYLEALAPCQRSLVIHGNFLNRQEIEFVGEHRDRMAIVYCPRTHAWFGHPRYPLEALLATGACIALGTDSRASNPDLSILAEMRYLFHTFPKVCPSKILKFGTLAGANALGLATECGSLEIGKRADLCAVQLPNEAADDPHELLLGTELPVARVIRGS